MKAVIRGKFIALNAYIKMDIAHISNFVAYLRKKEITSESSRQK